MNDRKPGDAVIACILAAQDVRKGAWVQGANSHVFAEFLAALDDRGWVLWPKVELPVIPDPPEPDA